MKRFPAEWEPQRFVQLTWPHADTDWADMLDEVNACFAELALAIVRFEPLLIVCADAVEVRKLIRVVATEKGGATAAAMHGEKYQTPAAMHGEKYQTPAAMRGEKHCTLELPHLHTIRFAELPSNDTWARDHGGITVLVDGQTVIYDYAFNGWGQKFEAGLDNELTRKLVESGALGKPANETTEVGDTSIVNCDCHADEPSIAYRDCLDFVLEGGSLESDGNGTLLTTSECLLSEFRNPAYTREMIEQRLKDDLGLRRVLWLNHGYLEGDDTDSHIDTLARFCDRNTIAYVRCDDRVDAHYEALQAMEAELRQFKTAAGQPYRLIPLPMADAAYDEDGDRLPATYANFLIVNGAVLMPVYGSAIKDELAMNQLKLAFPDREVVGVDCRALIKQHGSLHCVTMQY
jgi:agmatine deiminase